MNSKVQKELILEYIRANTDLINDKPVNNDTSQNKWIILADQLNSVPNGLTKDWKAWRKTWLDLKCRAKIKEYDLMNNISNSRGNKPRLSAFDEDILSLLKSTNSGHIYKGKRKSLVGPDKTINWLAKILRESEDSTNSQNIENNNLDLEIQNLDVRNLEENVTYDIDENESSTSLDCELPIDKSENATVKRMLPIPVNNEFIESNSETSFKFPENFKQMTSSELSEKMLAMEEQYYEKKLALMERNVVAKEKIAVALSTLAAGLSKDGTK